MRVTIVHEGNFLAAVVIDGEGHKVPWPSMPATFHALQWDGASGEVEHRMTVCEHCGARGKKPNEVVTDFAPYQPLVDAWHLAHATKAKADAPAT